MDLLTRVVNDNGQPLRGAELVRLRPPSFATRPDPTAPGPPIVYAIARSRGARRRAASPTMFGVTLHVNINIFFQGRKATGGAASGRAEERQVDTGRSVNRGSSDTPLSQS